MSEENPIDKLRAQVSAMLNGLDQERPIAATVVFMVKKDKEENFVSNSDKLTDATRRLSGCNMFAYHQRRPVEGKTPSDEGETHGEAKTAADKGKTVADKGKTVDEGKKHDATTIEYLIYEDWETVGQFQKQWHSEHLRDFQAQVLDLTLGFPDLRWYYGWSSSGGGRY